MTRKRLWGVALWAGLALCGPLASHGAVHKCVIKGAVHYQQAPCPQAEPRREPTLAELNEAQKRLPPPARPASRVQAAEAPSLAPGGSTTSAGSPIQADLPVGKGAAGFRCDGRTHCSQMKSCAEAKFFLANCPNVEMDGDGDGIPCEKQWCQP